MLNTDYIVCIHYMLKYYDRIICMCVCMCVSKHERMHVQFIFLGLVYFI